MKIKVIQWIFLFLNLGGSLSSQSITNSYSLLYIGPHNLHDHFLHMKSVAQKSASADHDILENIKSTYNIKPIKRDLEHLKLSNQDKFSTLIKREVAWSHPEYNEFGLLSCDDDLKFIQPLGPARYIELIPDGRRVLIQKYDHREDYQRAAQAAKELQTQCLIKTLEKSTRSTCNIKGIPFCFSDSWQQIWWKVTE